MTPRIAGFCAAAVLCLGLLGKAPPASAGSPDTQASEFGVVALQSAYSMADTLARLKKDIADKHLMFFEEIDQAKLARDAGINLRPSKLLVFGNPGLGTQFMTSNPQSGIDWPVRLLVYQNEKGEVWLVYNDFAYIAKRHGIEDRGAQFKMATQVIASIAASVRMR
jgi:uncharacterized protein (DUF302 family)